MGAKELGISLILPTDMLSPAIGNPKYEIRFRIRISIEIQSVVEIGISTNP